LSEAVPAEAAPAGAAAHDAPAPPATPLEAAHQSSADVQAQRAQPAASAEQAVAAHAAAPVQKTMEQQAAELAELQKLLAEERTKRIAAENRNTNLRIAEGSHAAVAGGGKPKGRRLEDCNVKRGNFAETLKACIEEFNRMPQTR
jgi:hypothetical protein